MKLITKEVGMKIPPLYSSENEKDPVIQVKFFNPCGSQTWYAIEYDPSTRECFGYVDLFGDGDGELGYFSLDELESIYLPHGLKIERDMYFNQVPLSQVKNK